MARERHLEGDGIEESSFSDVELDDDGTLRIPRQATYGSFLEGVLRCRVMRPEDQACVRCEIWVEAEAH